MKKTFPPDRKLSEPERLRIFQADKPILKQAARQTGIEEDELKRRAIHVGLKSLGELLGVSLDEKEKQAA